MTSVEEGEGTHTKKGFDFEDLGVEQGKMSEGQSYCLCFVKLTLN